MRLTNLVACCACGKAAVPGSDMRVYQYNFAGPAILGCNSEPCISRAEAMRKITTHPKKQWAEK